MEWTGARIKALRDARRETQEEMAHVLGVTVSTVNRWEKGVREPSRMACRLLGDLERNALPQTGGVK